VGNEELLGFLVEAKKNAYASGNGILINSIKPGSKDLPYKQGDFSYMDSYFGDVHFIGQEIVWNKEIPIWGMNYFGYTYDPVPGFPDFLFECLKQVSIENPFRGPEYYSNSTFEYRSTWTGEINSFQGEEFIYYQGKVIYSLKFHGGRIQYG